MRFINAIYSFINAFYKCDFYSCITVIFIIVCFGCEITNIRKRYFPLLLFSEEKIPVFDIHLNQKDILYKSWGCPGCPCFFHQPYGSPSAQYTYITTNWTAYIAINWTTYKTKQQSYNSVHTDITASNNSKKEKTKSICIQTYSSSLKIQVRHSFDHLCPLNIFSQKSNHPAEDQIQNRQ